MTQRITKKVDDLRAGDVIVGTRIYIFDGQEEKVPHLETVIHTEDIGRAIRVRTDTDTWTVAADEEVECEVPDDES